MTITFNEQLISKLADAGLTIGAYVALRLLLEGKFYKLTIDLEGESLYRLSELGYTDHTDGEYLINDAGRELLQLIDAEVIVYDERNNNSIKESFEDWWALYPRTDEWGHFPETRKIRTGTKGIVRATYNHTITGGRGTTEDLRNGLLGYMDYYKEQSSGKDNRLKYMVSPLRFLRENIWQDHTTNTTTDTTRQIDRDNVS